MAVAVHYAGDDSAASTIQHFSIVGDKPFDMAVGTNGQDFPVGDRDGIRVGGIRPAANSKRMHPPV